MKKSVLFLLLGLLFFSPAGYSAPQNTEVKKIIEKIEDKSNGWFTLKASLELQFFTGEEAKASCQGELLYQRLDEKMRLECFNTDQKLLFAFKTSEDRFELYIPGLETLYRGSVYDLEGSPNIESHLKPIDLYHALKLTPIPYERTTIETKAPGEITLRILSKYRGQDYVSRMLTSSDDGLVSSETYYDLNTAPLAVIFRSDYQKIKSQEALKKGPIFLPGLVSIETEGMSSLKKKTVLRFKKISLISTVENIAWHIPIPPKTQTVFIQNSVDQNALLE